MASVTFVNCEISNNDATGVYCASEGGGRLTNCAIRRNLGGGVYCDLDSAAILANCTISENSGPGVTRADDMAVVGLTNCILWGDVSPVIVDMGVWTSVSATYCDVQGGWEGVGNIDADPQLDPDGRLTTGSPCIDAGNTAAVPPDEQDLDGDGDTTERVPIDLAGDPRLVDDPMTVDTGVADPPDYPAVVDMGAYEYPVDGGSGPVLIEAYSVARHTPAGGFGGGDIGLPIDLNDGIVEPREQDWAEMWLRLVFDGPVSPSMFTVSIAPDPGLIPTLSAGSAADELNLSFDGTFPIGRYEFTLESSLRGSPWVMDGYVDASATLVGTSEDGSRHLWAGLRDGLLYVCTERAQADNDHFIFVAELLGDPRSPPWAKAGTVASWDAYLAQEVDNGWVGWFDVGDETFRSSVPQSDGLPYLEGQIDIAVELGVVPDTIYVAMGPYPTAVGSSLIPEMQVIPGNGDGNIDFDEYVPYAVSSDSILFPVCYVEGDVNCSGDTTGLDLARIQSPANWMKDLSQDPDPRADVNRDGEITGCDLAKTQSPAFWNQPVPPLTCTCP
jgi:hypothetical protein